MSKQTPPKTRSNTVELFRKEDLSVTEAAELLRVSVPTVYRLVDQKELDSWRKTASSGIRIYTKSVTNYIRNVQRRPLPNQAAK